MQGVSGLTPATLGNSADLQVGQQVVAIGSPRGLSGTVTTGIVSAFDRTVTVQGEDGSAVVYNGLQTDAPINQGNSGGPLVDLQGRVVGINSAIETAGGGSAGSIGLGFAIPVDQAERLAQEILDSGTATKPVLGVQGNAGRRHRRGRADRCGDRRGRRPRPPGWSRGTSSPGSTTPGCRTSPTSSPASAPTPPATASP
jgi:putative serine protease PepD